MSATLTMTTTMAATPTVPFSNGPTPTPTPLHHPPASLAQCCPSCGFGLPPPLTLSLDPKRSSLEAGKVESEASAQMLLEAQARIVDLEAQVRLLQQKASAAIDRWADYEDELAKLRMQLGEQQQGQHRDPEAAADHQGRGGGGGGGGGSVYDDVSMASPSPTRSSFLPSTAGAVANRLSAFLRPNLSRHSTQYSTRTHASTAAHSHTSTSHFYTPGMSPMASPGLESPHPLNAHAELLSALHHEQSLRVAAETRLSTTSQEIEDLSVSLFEEANEMVASERRARAQLEERVEVLQRRDDDKKKRLERIEGAMGRIERVRAVLGEEEVRKMKMRDQAGTELEKRDSLPDDSSKSVTTNSEGEDNQDEKSPQENKDDPERSVGEEKTHER